MKVFTIIGIVLTIVGAVLLFYSFATHTTSVFDMGPQAAAITGFVLLPMGLVFTAVGLYVGRLMGTSGQLLAEGLPGRATILAVSDSNVYINAQPLANLKMQVQVAGRPTSSIIARPSR